MIITGISSSCRVVFIAGGIKNGYHIAGLAVPGLQGDRLYEQRLRPELFGGRAGWWGPAEDRGNMIGSERSCDQILEVPMLF